MYSRVYSGAVNGVDAYRIEVEVDCSGGMGQINIVGLPDAAVKESQERVRSAIRACEILMPAAKKWTVNLAPADTRKEGPFLDLPIAVAILSSTGQLPVERLADFWIVGELGLDGAVRGVNGVLATAIACKASGATNLIVPEANAHEAALLDGLNVYAVSHLKQVCTLLCSPTSMNPIYSYARERFKACPDSPVEFPDFSEVKGQSNAKRALMIAAAGRHNVIMVGPPGSGKSMLAQRMPGIMPQLSFDEALELTKLYSVAGRLSEKTGVVSQRPFRSPHHSASLPGLVGGGSFPKPGEISLSHLGVLFLDEMTEFPRSHLDSLRQPMETGSVTISRAQSCFTFPANFLLVGACNPCPCGYRGDPLKYCVCTPNQADRYWARISGPILDRIDIQIEVGRINEIEMSSEVSGESSEIMRLKVMRAVERQRARLPEGAFIFNSQLGQAELRRYCRLSTPVREVLAKAVSQLGLSARAYDRVRRISRTIADLSDADEIEPLHVLEAVKYRHLRMSTCA
ncbi:MAG: YifB family Mg chelatase-like AAA ATPase [Candidatus Obscuribacterales bacterium]|jgi:magnesium chelatase family protein|nr:YifB family Mg chelatase-like AAA ATPase [Candidatus Obscuribacterales bacterium]